MENLDTGTAPATPAATEDLHSQSTSTAAPEAVATETQNAEGSIDDSLRAIWDKRNPARDDGGKFASRNPSEPALEGGPPDTTEGQASEAAPVEQAAPAIDAPISWPKEMKEKWATLPPDAQEFLAKRDSESHSAISRMGQQVKAFEPISQVIEQHRDVFARHQLQPDQGIAKLIQAQRYLDENPVAAIAWLAKERGVDLSVFANASGQPASSTPEVETLRAQISSLQRELQETSGYVRSRAQQEQQAQLTSLTSLVDDFLKDKPGLDDAALNEFSVLIDAEKRLTPSASPKDWLASAFETFQGRTPERRKMLFEQQRKVDDAKREDDARKKAADAKKAGNINVKSSPGSSASNKSLDDTLNEIARKHYR
jgi:hypothetical protein